MDTSLIGKVERAIRDDHLEVVIEVLLANPYVWREAHVKLCAELNRVRIIDWVYSDAIVATPAVGGTILATAAHAGSYQVYKWAKDRGYEWHGSVSMCSRAVLGGNLAIAKAEWNREDHRVPTCYTQWAAAGNHFDVLQWLHNEKDEPLDETTCWCAIFHDNLEMLRWAVARGVEVRDVDREKAAEKNNPAIVAFLSHV